MNAVRSIFSRQQTVLLGHINRLRVFPSVTVGIFQRGAAFYAIWPSTAVKLLEDVHSEADLLAVKNYHHLTGEYTIDPGTQLVFAFSPDDIVVGTLTAIKSKIAQRQQAGLAHIDEQILKDYLIIDS